MENKQGRIYGLRFGYAGQTFKASEIGREFGYRSLHNQFGMTVAGQKGTSKMPRYPIQQRTPEPRQQQEQQQAPSLGASLLGELDRLDAIGKQTARAAELLKKLIDQAAQTKITVNVEPLQQHSDKLTRELKKQVQHVMQSPIVLKVIVGLTVVALVATWAAGYYIRDCRVWE